MNHMIARMTASHCCICMKKLTDAESVEMGIGPVCSRKYYNPDFLPTEDQIQSAIGLLSASDLPDYIIDGFLSCVDNLEGKEKKDARRACNLLIYWASCHYYDRDEVFKCSRIIRALGYEALADKLETDRTAARLEERGDILRVLVNKRKSCFFRDLKRIPGSKMTGKIAGDKAEWEFPINEKRHFMAVLGCYYGGELACDTTSVWLIPRTTFRDVMSFRSKPVAPKPAVVVPAATPAPKPKQDIILKTDFLNGVLEVFTPFNAGYIEALKKAVPYKYRRWTGSCWVIDLAYSKAIRDLLDAHFNVVL